MWIGVLCLIASVGCYSLSQLQQHGKLRWMDETKPFNFIGRQSHRRKYKNYNSASGERWFTSTTLTVFLTDFYHLMQFFMFIFLSLSITFAAGFDWWLLIKIWSGIHLLHFGVYKMFQR